MVDERGAQARTHGAGVTGAIECRYYGRDFTAGEMALLRALIACPPPLNRHMLSKEFCRRIGWFKPDGGLKDMMARVAMLAMHRDGLIALPAPQGRQNRPGPIVFGPDTEAPLFPAPTTLDKVRPLDLRPVVRGTRESKLWNEFVARYHYLGYRTLVGAQMRYAVHDRDGWPLAMLGFSTAAWKLAPRDNFIGWTRQLREKNLPFVVDNPRFLILPWINIPNLGSHILALIRRRLPDDWTERYNTTPVLIETFVETPRYTGAVYRASGWTRVGTTQGRGRPTTGTGSPTSLKRIRLRPPRPGLETHPQSLKSGAYGNARHDASTGKGTTAPPFVRCSDLIEIGGAALGEAVSGKTPFDLLSCHGLRPFHAYTALASERCRSAARRRPWEVKWPPATL